jgi:SpoVK/Ycf46/Vps4 family AAA+-type ATPase
LKNPSDFIGTVLGSSESQTRAILAEAEGSVLVIDEAYLLCSANNQDVYKSAVIDTIVEQVQNRPGDNRAVLMIGYRKEMEAMMKAANPGLARRFSMEQSIEFKDYDDESLIRILRAAAKKDGMAVSYELATFAVQQLAKARALPHFGNAGSVNTLLGSARLNMQKRLSHLSLYEKSVKGIEQFVEEDFLDRKSRANFQREEEENFFEGLVGCNSVKMKLEEYRQTIALTKRLKKDPKDLIDFNFVFAGSPGTGKVRLKS